MAGEHSLPEPDRLSLDIEAIRARLAQQVRALAPELAGVAGTWENARSAAARLSDDPDWLVSEVARRFDAWFDDTDEVVGTAEEVDEDPRLVRGAVEMVLPDALTPDAMLAALARAEIEQPADLVETIACWTACNAARLHLWTAQAAVDAWHPGERLRRELEQLPTVELPDVYDRDALAHTVERLWPAHDGAAWVDGLASGIHYDWPTAADHVSHDDFTDHLETWKRHGWTAPPSTEDLFEIAAGHPCPNAPTSALRAEWLRTRRRRRDTCTDIVQYAFEVAARHHVSPATTPGVIAPRTDRRARGRRTRTARTRAAGARSGNDPGDGGDPPPEHPPHASLHRPDPAQRPAPQAPLRSPEPPRRDR